MNAPVDMHRNKWGTRWTADMDEVLQRELASGKSFRGAVAVINKAFGTSLTRNAAIGRASRKGMPSRGGAPAKTWQRRTCSPKPATKTIMRAVPVTNARGNITFRMKPKTVLAEDAIDRTPIKLGPAATSFFEIGPRDCRWPYGDPRDLETFRFCGDPTEEAGKPYCAGHTRQAKGSGAP